MDLRKPFWNTMCELAENDKSIRVLTGDLGFSFLEEFKEKYPDQFINCGIAEQSMVGIAAGMALAGLKPYVYSGSIFLLARAYEQVRDDVAYNGTNVKLIGTGASQFLGFSHNWTGTENENDLLKNLPIKQFYPKSEVELKEALLVSGPAYIRL
jgi:transketolase